MDMPVGNRIYLKRKLPPASVLEGLRLLPAANIADCMYRICAMNNRIRLLSAPKQSMCGPALTVHVRAGDNLFFHKALDLAQEGDVIVVSTGASEVNSMIGEVIVSNAIHKKLGGLVFDAPIRDIDAISQMDFPVYATGTTPGGPFRTGPGGEINTPISCGNILVCPGDVVKGDPDGIIVIPRLDAASVLEKALAYAEKDRQTMEQAKAGTWDRRWIDETLERIGTEIVDDFYPV